MTKAINYGLLESGDVLEMISSGVNLAKLAQYLYLAGNLEGYEIVDQYIEKYGYN